MTKEPLIPATPSQEEYAVEADQGDVFTQEDPIALFEEWLALAISREVNDPNTMSLATVDATGRPDVRMVLLKDVAPRGFTFYSHTTSAKGADLAAVPYAALCFHWKSIRRQVRVQGAVTSVSPEESDMYFASRSRGAKIGAWASKQSEHMVGRDMFEARLAHYEEKYPDVVPRPPNWQGFLVAPERLEFWVNRPFRLHDRLVFERDGEDWTTSRLYP